MNTGNFQTLKSWKGGALPVSKAEPKSEFSIFECVYSLIDEELNVESRRDIKI